MNALFLNYTIFITCTILTFITLAYYTFVNRQITPNRWLFILIGMIVINKLEYTIKQGQKVNEKLSVEFKVPKDFYSNSDVIENDTISDGLLYNHLLSMRALFPKIILIQAKIESNNYTSMLYQKNKNMFGMKISTERVTTSGDGRAGYKSYVNWKESVMDYILWQFSHNIEKLTQEEYINYLGKIYAEDPKYTNKIRSMLNTIDFEKLENE